MLDMTKHTYITASGVQLVNGDMECNNLSQWNNIRISTWGNGEVKQYLNGQLILINGKPVCQNLDQLLKTVQNEINGESV